MHNSPPPSKFMLLLKLWRMFCLYQMTKTLSKHILSTKEYLQFFLNYKGYRQIKKKIVFNSFQKHSHVYCSIIYIRKDIQFSSVQSLSHVWLCNPVACSTLGFLIHHQLLKLVQTHVHWVDGVIQNISSSVVPFSSCLKSFPATGSFPMSQFFASGDQSIGASASASVLPKNIQDWFPLGLIGLISLQSKGLSRVSNNTVQKYKFFGTQLSLWYNSHIHTWQLEKP